MLSDRERETLDEIQRRLLVEDPRFAQSFTTGAQRLQRGPSDRIGLVYTIFLVVSSTFAVILLMVGSLFNALILAVLAAALWETRRHYRTGPDHKGRGRGEWWNR